MTVLWLPFELPFWLSFYYCFDPKQEIKREPKQEQSGSQKGANNSFWTTLVRKDLQITLLSTKLSQCKVADGWILPSCGGTKGIVIQIVIKKYKNICLLHYS